MKLNAIKYKLLILTVLFSTPHTSQANPLNPLYNPKTGSALGYVRDHILLKEKVRPKGTSSDFAEWTFGLGTSGLSNLRRPINSIYNTDPRYRDIVNSIRFTTGGPPINDLYPFETHNNFSYPSSSIIPLVPISTTTDTYTLDLMLIIGTFNKGPYINKKHLIEFRLIGSNSSSAEVQGTVQDTAQDTIEIFGNYSRALQDTLNEASFLHQGDIKYKRFHKLQPTNPKINKDMEHLALYIIFENPELVLQHLKSILPQVFLIFD